MPDRIVRLASAAYSLDPLVDFAAYRAKITAWVNDAVGQGAHVLVFPEYGAMELAHLAGPDVAGDLMASIDAVSDLLPEVDALHQALAMEHGVTIVAASAPERQGPQRVVNVARIFGPTGKSGRFEKLMMTPWERKTWHIQAGRVDKGDPGLTVFDLGDVKLGLVICYDIEFPFLSRILAESGADIILAPSNTETAHGYWRVRIGAMARALENQVYTVQSPTVGPAPWCEAVDANYGAAGIFAPSDTGLPAGGVVALGAINTPGWVIADLDLGLMQTLRAEGGVQTYRHWQEQPGSGPLPQARCVSLV